MLLPRQRNDKPETQRWMWCLAKQDIYYYEAVGRIICVMTLISCRKYLSIVYLSLSFGVDRGNTMIHILHPTWFITMLLLLISKSVKFDIKPMLLATTILCRFGSTTKRHLSFGGYRWSFFILKYFVICWKKFP